MKITNIFTNEQSSFSEGKADLLLVSFSDKTSKDKKLLLTPTLNAEFITNEKVFSSSNPKISPSAIIARAIHNLNPLSAIEILDLGLQTLPQNARCENFNISSLDSAKDIFEKGMIFGRRYEIKGNYLILAQNSVSELTAVITSVLALDFETENREISNFEKLSIASNSMMFCTGFLLEASRRFHVVLSGSIEMAVCLFIADKLREDVLMRVKHDNITFATTKENLREKNATILNLLSELSYTPHAIYTDFDFSTIEIEELKEYSNKKGEINIGALLAYAITHKIEYKTLLDEIEIVSYSV